MLVVLVTLGVICHAQMPRPDASDDKSCATELAICQALLGAVHGKEATDVVRLAAITPPLNPNGARTHSPAAAWPSHARTACAQTAVPCRAECARRQEHERRAAADRRRAVPRVERSELRSEAAGVSSAQQCAQAVDQPDYPG